MTNQLADRVDITHYLAEVRATPADAQALAAEFTDFTVMDGRVYAQGDDFQIFRGLLWGVADKRRDDRVETADKGALAAHKALLAHPRRPLGMDRVAWVTKGLDLHAAVVAAIVELCDAKQDAELFSASHADKVRADARTEHAYAVRLMQATVMRAVRSFRAARRA